MAEWRTGCKVGLNVYKGDQPMFQCHTPEDARRIVKLLNLAEDIISRVVRYEDTLKEPNGQ